MCCYSVTWTTEAGLDWVECTLEGERKMSIYSGVRFIQLIAEIAIDGVVLMKSASLVARPAPWTVFHGSHAPPDIFPLQPKLSLLVLTRQPGIQFELLQH